MSLIGEGFGVPDAGVSAAAPRAGAANRSGCRRIGNRAERGGAGFERGLAAHDLVELLVELFLIEQLAAGGAIDLGAQLGDAVFVGVLHFGLTGDQPGQDVVAKREIGGGRRRPHAEQDDGADDDPEHHGADSDLLAGMDDGVAMTVEDGCGGLRGGAPWRRPAVIMGMVVVGTMTGTVRHRHSRAGRR